MFRYYLLSLDPCEDIECSINAQCVVDNNHKASCQCPKCPRKTKKVCGTDGKTYINECELRKESCKTKTNITVLHDGKCSKFRPGCVPLGIFSLNISFYFSSFQDPCEDIKCSFKAQCVVDSNYKASCQCPKCPPTTKEVCGSDGKTYINECELRRQSCTTKTVIRVFHEGKCSTFLISSTQLPF